MKKAEHTLKKYKKKAFLFDFFFPVHCERTFMLDDQFEIHALGKLVHYKSKEAVTEDNTHGFPQWLRGGVRLLES